ncbi:MAG: DUF2804 domain-containing protein [Spirochaetaceae bacterium]|jgi:hypothetical protein|nr:DUF2804 domain-containing protein [Spirochaetaceae bacterium]
MMYTREIRNPGPSLVERGEPLQGTWLTAFDEVDLLTIRKPFPFPVPVPRWARNWRLKEWQTFAVQDDRFFLSAAAGNMKSFRWVQVFLYDKEEGGQIRYRKLAPLGGWRMPRSLANSSIDCRFSGFFFRIHHWLDANTVKIDLDIEPARSGASFTAHLEYAVDPRRCSPVTVSLLLPKDRCFYACKSVTPVQGDIVFGGRHLRLDPARTTGFFGDFKGYYPYRAFWTRCTGTGFDKAGRRYGFSVAENRTLGSFKNNENVLWVDGNPTPLPPVRVTMPGGPEAEWVIQDVEGMVDLVFTPKESFRSGCNLLAVRAEYDTPLGHYNGTLVDSAGNTVDLRNHWGMGENLYMRL